MGADMIGYQTMLPAEFTTKEKKELNEYLDRVEALLKTPNLHELVAAEESSKGKYLQQLNDLVPDIPYKLDEEGLNDEPEEIKGIIEEYIDLIPQGRGMIDVLDIDGRDISSRVYTLLGRQFISIFAGDMSWGDEPSGNGYQTLKDLDRIGLLHKMESMTIPTESLSIQIIKGD
jgi:hypothetical protein